MHLGCIMRSFSEFASKMEGRTSIPGLAARYSGSGSRTKASLKSASVTDVSGRSKGGISSSAGGTGKGGASGGVQDEGSISDSAVSSTLTESQQRNRRSSLGCAMKTSRNIFELLRSFYLIPRHFSYKMAAFVGLSRKSKSALQLNSTKKGLSQFARSEEVGSDPNKYRYLTRQASKDSTDGSIASSESNHG